MTAFERILLLFHIIRKFVLDVSRIPHHPTIPQRYSAKFVQTFLSICIHAHDLSQKYRRCTNRYI